MTILAPLFYRCFIVQVCWYFPYSRPERPPAYMLLRAHGGRINNETTYRESEFAPGVTWVGIAPPGAFGV